MELEILKGKGIKMENNKELSKELYKEVFNEDLVQVVLSGKRSGNEIEKAKIRPVIIKGILVFQVTETLGTKVLHSNHTLESAADYMEDKMKSSFRQGQITTKNEVITVLVSKKGSQKITRKKVESVKVPLLDHNRTKKYLLQEGIPVPFLVDLGVMSPQGRVFRPMFSKFRQINRFLEFIDDIVYALDKKKQVNIIDFGCGKSYLTFAMYYFLKEIKGFDINVIGLDLKEDVIQHCNDMAVKYKYDSLKFIKGDIRLFEEVDSVDMVVSLHACDTATDYALAKGVKWGAKVILSVPCCQHEINGQIQSELLEPILKYGILKERMSAIITDAIRGEALTKAGYNTQLLEFIDMEHTPKNILIRGVKTGKVAGEYKSTSVEKMISEMNISPTILKLLEEES